MGIYEEMGLVQKIETGFAPGENWDEFIAPLRAARKAGAAGFLAGMMVLAETPEELRETPREDCTKYNFATMSQPPMEGATYWKFTAGYIEAMKRAPHLAGLDTLQTP